MPNMKILITGASGFIGRHLTDYLLARNVQIRVLTRNPEKLPHNWVGRLEVIQGNLLDPGHVQRALQGITLIYNLAGETQDTQYMNAVNVEAVQDLLASAKKADIEKLIHLSSAGVVGDKGLEITEESSCTPNSLYEQTKLEGEQAVLDFGQNSQLPVVIIRPTIVFGEGQIRSRDSLLEWLRAIKARRFFYIGRRAVANYIYVRDLVAILCKLADPPASSGKVYIASDSTSMRQFVSAMEDGLNLPPTKMWIPTWLGYSLGCCFELGNTLVSTPAPLTRARVRALSSQRMFRADKLFTFLENALPYGYRAGLLRTIHWYKEVGFL